MILFLSLLSYSTGTDDRGNPANDVETEQIVYDASMLSHRSGRFTSFLQVRASVPIPWQQEENSMKAKRAITIARSDPFASMAALHFERVCIFFFRLFRCCYVFPFMR